MLQDKQYKVQANQRGTTPAEQFSNSQVIVKSSRVASLKLEWQPFFPQQILSHRYLFGTNSF